MATPLTVVSKTFTLIKNGFSGEDILNTFTNEILNMNQEEILYTTGSTIQMVENIGDLLGYGSMESNTMSAVITSGMVYNQIITLKDSIVYKDEIDLHKLNNLLGDLFIIAGDSFTANGIKGGVILSAAGLYIKEYGDATYGNEPAIVAASEFFNKENMLGFIGDRFEAWSKFVYKILPDAINPWLDIEDAIEYINLNRSGEYHIVDPLTLDLDGDGIETVKIDGLNSILFDHDADGIRTATGWVKADDGLLVLDSNGDGKIDTGRELFGDNRLLKDGSLAPTGFAALAEHDDNGDGKIDAQDAVFEQLKVWRDLNQDGVSQAEELFTLEQLGIQSLDLNHQAVNQRQGNGNTVARLGSYTTTDGSTHKMGDLLFDNNAMISRFSDEVELSAAQKDSVNLRGMGRLRDLQQAAAKSSALADVIQDYSAAQTKQEQLALRDKLILEWANTDINPMYAFHLDRVSIQTASSGVGLTPGQLKNVFLGPELAKINGEFHQLKDKIRILDSFTGQRSSLIAYTNLEDAKRILNVIKDSYDKLAEQLYAGLLFQTRLKPYTDHISLSFKDGKLALDFSQTAAVFNQIHTKDPHKAFVDLGEFLYYSDAMKKNDTFAKLSSLFMEYAQSSISSGNFETDLAILGKEKFIALGHHLGTEQDETLKGTDLANLISGGAGNDKLYGNGGDDRLIGGEGNDRLEGGKGNDVYVFSKGHGQDSLYDPYNDSGDRIVFTDLNYADMTFRQDGSHLILASGENDYVKIDYFFSSQQYKIEHFEFADKTISLDEMMENGLILHGTEQNETIQHWQGKMIAYAGAGNDSLIGADKDDELYGEEGNDRLVGNGGDDRLIGGEGNDRLEGGKGNDVYVFSKGHGQDSLYDPYNDSGDRIVFTDLNYADMTFRQDGSHLILASGENDYVKIDYFFSSQQYKIEHFEFADKTISLDEMMENGLILHGTEQNETIQHWQGKMIAYAGAGNDSLIGADKDDELHGEAGNDKLYGNAGDDRLIGGEGNDRLEGGKGNDVYVFSKGHGQDSLYDPYNDSGDRIVFTDLNYADMTFRQDGSHLILASGENDYVKIDYFFSSQQYKIEHFEFADKTISLDEMMKNGLILHGTEQNETIQHWQGKMIAYAGAGNDSLIGADKDDELYGEEGNDRLVGNGGDDRLIGGEGNDRLEGGKGNDVYVFSKGHGQDSLYDPYNDSGDRIVFTDLNYADMTFRQDGSHLILASGENDYVKIDYFFSSQQYKIEHFEFADKTISLDEMMKNGLILHGTEQNETIQHWQGKMIAYAGAGNDSLIGADKDDELYGEEGNDRLVGNGGDDRLYGGGGEDYLYAGAGNDMLSGGQGADRLHGGAGADVFIFDSLDAVDTLEDFNAKEDSIALDKSLFTALGENIEAAEFAFGGQAENAEQRLVFDSKTGALLYDADGSGEAAAVHIATIRGSALNALSHEQFALI